MSIKKGMCTNEECELCYQIQEADEANFVCKNENCGHKLIPAGDDGDKGGGIWKKHGKKIILGVAAVAILGGVGYGISTLFGGKEKTDPDPPEPSKKDSVIVNISENEMTLKIGKSETLTATVDTLKDQLVWSVDNEEIATVSADGKVSGKKAGEVTITANINVNDTNIVVVPATCKVNVTDNGKKGPDDPKPETLKLSYGTYTGAIKNGYPHGMGRLVYSRSRVINKYDEKGRSAEAGDYVQGEFVNGFFIQGRHYGSDGSLIESIMVGVPAGNSYDSK